ncbi:MAG: mannose-1-phosphate guanylyltransferase [Bacteroidetes bacterium GWC2_33_15]|nr:MAG: mannose-1-phosphate guanylyltransferase [Bacteroidetes bacterium GWA2_33_15]OFX49424.1 MAG: mannose-1-phosphate guanylyltransferase [Bacteroidetes bacterium GWC2_33_15]OFX63083.1 MAG: mannose-1-phosphate guanylyltransferase [Bacteroidetes bacterium GWB2_32_14]OFX68773.1 MAG: mannose-1-phosphate guanylyltransferase [Bacteroidetes bacterium GWD2_33_33]HAN19138.1 mannose-1-phosphate guanylyltransferase [Bacteroidales bacterium]
MNKNNYCVIMAGGVGSRFWPLSRSNKPKQFLDILGTGRTLLQMTFDRFKTICPVENIFVVTGTPYGKLIAEQLPELSENQILFEPIRRNTAPCIAYANYKIFKINPDANIVTAPSDHLILNETEFKNVILQGLDFISDKDALLTLGIKPSRPETGYGYIQFNQKQKESKNSPIFKVKTFTEKPNKDLAQVFLDSGEFFWNSGIFIWSLKSIMKAFNSYLPEIDSLFKEGYNMYNTDQEESFISKTYFECRNISIDYGIMEKADNVFVYCSNFGWADLGTWGSLYEYLPQDENKNSIRGKNTFTYNLENCIVNLPDDKLAVVQGLSNYIVVESDGILLICKKEDEQEIKQFVNDIKLKNGDQYL